LESRIRAQSLGLRQQSDPVAEYGGAAGGVTQSAGAIWGWRPGFIVDRMSEKENEAYAIERRRQRRSQKGVQSGKQGRRGTPSGQQRHS
jgi:hypothetical protein